jgi:hypothetical protein
LSTAAGLTFTAAGLLANVAGGYTWGSATIDDLSAASIKSMNVICIEKYIVGADAAEPRYYITINPTRPFTSGAPVGIYYAPTYQLYIKQSSTALAMPRITSIQSAGESTEVILEHVTYGENSGTESYWSGADGNPLANKTLEYLGILIELM